eukprot:CAMPEP_0194406726 /NCGR_PEP_ID=MMETSP0176-20130528/4830_1 /TAXON_ID=216777 /ORGANISM="Proboscia alata, Strain PI-D3" /LENGTH=342 /DNA_ID=CAMNT_0039206017 /DNA_START=46 /DNA_END=1071 /DNA_ORIENTATION=-
MTVSNGSGSNARDCGSGASKTTIFSAAIKILMIPTIATFLLATMGFSIRVAAIPYLYSRSRMLHSENGETSVQFWTKFIILEFFSCGFLLAFICLVGLLLPMIGVTLTAYHALAFYLPMYTISLHDRRYQYGPFGTFVVQTFFDMPLMIAGYVCREFFDVRLLAPFCNILDDTIVQGSLPFPSDIATLAAEPYNVGLIVNMCREYLGATVQMKKHNIVQCHLPHQDTTAPSYESLVRGCACIQQFKKDHPTKRVYIHCKGGIARASTMTLAHYVCNEDQDPLVAVQTMNAKRPVVFTGVRDFPAILKLNDERLEKMKRIQAPQNGCPKQEQQMNQNKSVGTR